MKYFIALVSIIFIAQILSADGTPDHIIREAEEEYLGNADYIIEEYKYNLTNDTLDYLKFEKMYPNGHPEKRLDYDIRGELIRPVFIASQSQELSKNEKLLDFLIYIVENEPSLLRVGDAVRGIGNFAFFGNKNAGDYLRRYWNDEKIPFRVRLSFCKGILLSENNSEVIDYLIDLILESQESDSLTSFLEPPLGAQIQGLISSNIDRLKACGLEYNYLEPILRQLIFYRNRIIQFCSGLSYYRNFGPKACQDLIEECWEVINNKESGRIDFINSLFGLQAFCYPSARRNFPDMNLTPIENYFLSLVSYTITDEDGHQLDTLRAIDKKLSENRITLKEKVFFSKRKNGIKNDPIFPKPSQFWIRGN